jgi:hypothetical protein
MTMPAPAPAPAAPEAGPDPAEAAAAWARVFFHLVNATNRRVGGDIGAAIGWARDHGADPADLEVIEAYAVAEPGSDRHGRRA